MNDSNEIKTEEELISVIGKADDIVHMKVMNYLDAPAIEFVKLSPLIFVSTVSSSGHIDVSPKGDMPGFVKIEGANRLVIPDRPGNKLVFGFKNILKNKHIGLIFVVPNMRETLRVKGTAHITKDPDLLDQFKVNGKPALLCTVIDVHECFIHCGKAMIRSKVWQPDSWKTHQESLMTKQLSRLLNLDKETEQLVDSATEQIYRENLW